MTREDMVNLMSLEDAIQVFRDTNCYGTMYIAKTVILKALEQKPKTGYISIDDVMSVFDDFMCGEDDEAETFLEMLKDKLAESEVDQ